MSITTNVSSNPAHGEVYSIQHYVIKFVSDLRLMVFSWYSGFLHNITEILLEVALHWEMDLPVVIKANIKIMDKME